MGEIAFRWGIAIALLATLPPVIMMYLTWLERKVMARIQNRYGPNRVGKYGLLQPIADGIKLLLKEDIAPAGADRVVHFLAPVVSLVPVLLIFTVIPFGQGLIAVDLNIGLLFFLAMGALGTIAIFMAGWSSRNKFSLLGALRAAAQIMAYEVPMVLSVVAVVMAAGTLSTVGVVEAQATQGWFIFTPWGVIAFLLFFISGLAEVNRTPFDLSEAESEIVAGFHTEYSGMKFALFFMAEFLSAFAIAALSVTLFWGGWMGPVLPGLVWFLIKTYLLIFVMIWIRGTLPRLRIDQLLGLAWKLMLPLSLVNLGVVGIWILSPLWVGWMVGSILIAVSWRFLARAAAC